MPIGIGELRQLDLPPGQMGLHPIGGLVAVRHVYELCRTTLVEVTCLVEAEPDGARLATFTVNADCLI